MTTALAVDVRRRRFGGGSFASASEGNRSFSSAARLPPHDRRRYASYAQSRVLSGGRPDVARRVPGGQIVPGGVARKNGARNTHVDGCVKNAHCGRGALDGRSNGERVRRERGTFTFRLCARAPHRSVGPVVVGVQDAVRRAEPWTAAIVGVVGALFARVGETRANSSTCRRRRVQGVWSRWRRNVISTNNRRFNVLFHHHDPPTVGRNGAVGALTSAELYYQGPPVVQRRA